MINPKQTPKNQIDFSMLMVIIWCNPNIDPGADHFPRITVDDLGLINSHCVKRKVRNRLQDMGYAILVQSDDRHDDEYRCLADRIAGEIPNYDGVDDFVRQACEKWLDVKLFGHAFAYKNKQIPHAAIKGAVTINEVLSISPVETYPMQISKSVNGENDETKGDDQMSSDRLGSKVDVVFGLYRVNGSINVKTAEKNGLTEDEIEAFKKTLPTMFVNDASAARPSGSMEVLRVYWWTHNCREGQYSSAKVFRTLKCTPKPGVMYPASIDDYDITLESLPGLEPEIIEGF